MASSQRQPLAKAITPICLSEAFEDLPKQHWNLEFYYLEFPSPGNIGIWNLIIWNFPSRANSHPAICTA